MERKITKYIHAIQSGTICNLRCQYCYVPDLEHENRLEPTKFNYPLEQIAKAISKERIGGTALITYVGGGETFLTDESIELLKLFLLEGHVLNAASNMTYTPSIEKICNFPDELKKRLQFSGSFHYKELVKRNLLETYFNNLQKCYDAGITSYVNLTLGNDCKDEIDNIKELVYEKTGKEPFILYCLDAKENWKRCSFFTSDYLNFLSQKVHIDHLLIENEISYEKRQNKFCYMGDWGLVYNLETGTISPCFDTPASMSQNIVENLDKPIKFKAIGTCCSNYCAMGARFLGLGVVPDIKKFSNYSELYKNYKMTPVSNLVSKYTNNYLWETNKKYSWLKEKIILLCNKFNPEYKIGTWMNKQGK